jgi:hypothetical protein
MEKLKTIARRPSIAIIIFFIAVFFYYVFIGKYSLIYQEQIQLFLYDPRFLYDFLARPGGLTDYLGIFLIQFYYVPLLGALIMTLAGFGVFHISTIILKKFNITTAIPSLVPVLFLIILQHDPYLTISYTAGLILSMGAVVFYTNRGNYLIRYLSGTVLWLLLYAAAGGFSFFALILFMIYELFTSKNILRFPVTGLWIIAALAIPYLLWLTVYQIPLPEAWFSQNLTPVNIQTMRGCLALLLYYPVVIAAFGAWHRFFGRKIFKPGWNWYTLLTGLAACFLIFLSVPGLKRMLINQHRVAVIMKLDDCIQHRSWERGIRISSGYKRTDPLVVFYTNICLLKAGKLSDSMFNYRQVGRSGLILDWVEDNVTPFFGDEVFYQLGYVNESYRWAYEALIATGQGPRVLKRLVIASILNNDDKVAGKYIDILSRSLFYNKWAVDHRNYINREENDKIPGDLVLASKLNVKKDFFYDLDNYNADVKNMIENNPGNKEIFEYSMALHMLEKDLASLIQDAGRLKEYGYTAIPVHIEEALLVYMVNTNQNVVPQGFSIRESTMQRFRYYLSTNATYVARSRAEAAKALSKEYHNTYWYYSQFF